MTRTRPVAAAMLLSLMIHPAGGSEPAPPPTADQTAASPTASEVIAARKAGFMLSAGVVAAMKHTIDSDEDVSKWAFGARGLAAWAKAIPTMFPPEPAGSGSKALPAIWNDAAGFAAIAEKYRTDALQLAKLAAANDKPGFAAQWAVVRADCESCHSAYRAD